MTSVQQNGGVGQTFLSRDRATVHLYNFRAPMRRPSPLPHRMIFAVSLLLFVAALPSAAGVAIVSPWPSGRHDSGATYAANPATPTFERYCENELHDLPLSDFILIPSPGIYVSYGVATDRPQPVSVYNSTKGDVSTINLPAQSFVLGTTSSMQLYYLTFSDPLRSGAASAIITAASLSTGAALWTQAIPILPNIFFPMVSAQVVYNTYADAIDVCSLGPQNETCARYDGPTGKLLWSQSKKTPPNLTSPSEVPQLGLENGDLVTLSDNAVLICRDANTGEVVWSNAETVATIPCRLLAVGDVLVYADSTSVVALNASTGDLMWNVTATHDFLPVAAALLPAKQGASPRILIGRQGGVMLLDADTGNGTSLDLALTDNVVGLVTINQTVVILTLSDKQSLTISTWSASGRADVRPMSIYKDASPRGTTPYTLSSTAIDSDGSMVSTLVGSGRQVSVLAPLCVVTRKDGRIIGIILGSTGGFVVLLFAAYLLRYGFRGDKSDYDSL